MASNIYYKKSVARDLKNLDRSEAKRAVDQLESELGQDPDRGEQLKGKFAGLMKLRIGDYRVIYARTRDGVLILLIAHRKDVYQKLERSE